MGISVLWNDYRSALSIAKALDLKFIRIPVFVDKVKTDYGIMEGNPKDVLIFQKSIEAQGVALFTDIHVKHATLISKHDITTSAKLAIKNGSDGIIIIGKWTGDAPKLDELIKLREDLKEFPILIGSGVDKKNISSLFKYANGAIVSTSIKKGLKKMDEVNIKPYQARIDIKRTKDMTKQIK